LNFFVVMSLPAAYTNGADAMGRSNTHYERQSISFTVESFKRKFLRSL